MMEKPFEINDVGLNIKCKLYCNNPRNIRRVIISCHGICGNKENKATKKMAETLLPQYDDLAVIAFDWPCHGKDIKQKLSLKDCDDYLASVIRYIKEEMGVEELYAQATSFGGYLVLKYISEHKNPFQKIALRCPAVNIHDILTSELLKSDQLEQIQKGKVGEIGFERKIKIGKGFLQDLEDNDIRKRDYVDFADDVIVLQGTSDELVDPTVVRDFCEQNVIEYIPIEGADHRFQHPAKLRECIDYIEYFYGDSLQKDGVEK